MIGRPDHPVRASSAPVGLRVGRTGRRPRSRRRPGGLHRVVWRAPRAGRPALRRHRRPRCRRARRSSAASCCRADIVLAPRARGGQAAARRGRLGRDFDPRGSDRAVPPPPRFPRPRDADPATPTAGRSGALSTPASSPAPSASASRRAGRRSRRAVHSDGGPRRPDARGCHRRRAAHRVAGATYVPGCPRSPGELASHRFRGREPRATRPRGPSIASPGGARLFLDQFLSGRQHLPADVVAAPRRRTCGRCRRGSPARRPCCSTATCNRATSSGCAGVPPSLTSGDAVRPRDVRPRVAAVRSLRADSRVRPRARARSVRRGGWRAPRPSRPPPARRRAAPEARPLGAYARLGAIRGAERFLRPSRRRSPCSPGPSAAAARLPALEAVAGSTARA